MVPPAVLVMVSIAEGDIVPVFPIATVSVIEESPAGMAIIPMSTDEIKSIVIALLFSIIASELFVRSLQVKSFLDFIMSARSSRFDLQYRMSGHLINIPVLMLNTYTEYGKCNERCRIL